MTQSNSSPDRPEDSPPGRSGPRVGGPGEPQTDGWVVESLVPGGQGFLRAEDGRATFVPGGLPGDVVQPLEVDERKRSLHVRSFLLLDGPNRRETPCTIADRCGGCDWMALPRDEQLRWKRTVVVEAFRRTARLDVDPGDVVTAGDELGWRSRIRLQVREGHVGFFERGSHRLVEVSQCAVADRRLDAGVDWLNRLPREALARLDSVELRAADEGPCLFVLDRPPRHPAWDSLPDGWALAGGGSQRTVVDGISLEVPADAFVQVHGAANRALVDAVVEGAKKRGVSSFCEVYGGIGNFGLPLSRLGPGVSIEAVGSASDAARRTAAEAGLSLTVIAGDAAQSLRTLKGKFDLVLLDPPRAGVKAALPPVMKLAPRWIAFVACDPVTLARDVATLVARGWRLDELAAFDLFPQTHHVEVLAWLAAPE